MTAAEIRELFASGWSFRLFAPKGLPWPVIAAGIAIAIWAVGAIVAVLLGVFPLFAGNLLAYPIGTALALSAYGWFTRALPRTLEILYPALAIEPEQYKRVIKKWANRLYNPAWVILLFAAPIMIVTLVRLITLWSQPGTVWLGAPWVNSDQRLFFAVYYGFYDVPVGGFLLGNGVAGIVMSLLLIYDLLGTPLKLAYHRELRAIGSLSLGLASWTLVAFAFVGPAQVLIVTPALYGAGAPPGVSPSAIGLSIVASLLILAVLFAPVLIARQAVINAKFQQLAGLEEVQHNTYRMIQQITRELAITPISSASVPPGEEFSQLRQHLEHLDTIEKLIKEIESIPDWPLTWRGTLQIVGAAVTPFLGTLLQSIPLPFDLK